MPRTHPLGIFARVSTPTDPSDAELIARMARGDERALGVLYDRHVRALFGLALTIAGQPADAEEVVADAFAGTRPATALG